MHLPRRFATIWHYLGVLLRQITHPVTLQQAHDRLVARNIAHPVLATKVLVHKVGPLLHTSQRCAHNTSAPCHVTVSEVIASPKCQHCSWESSTSFGKLLTLAAWWFAIIDLTEHELAPTWRNAMLLDAATKSAALLPLNVNAAHVSALDPLRRQVTDKAKAASASALARNGIEPLHRALAAFAYSHPVPPSQARGFAKWAANTGVLQPLMGETPQWDAGLASSLGQPMQVLAVNTAAPLKWAQNMLDASVIVAASEFYPQALLTPLTHGVYRGVLPELTARGLAELGFDIVVAAEISTATLEMTAQLFDPTHQTELGDLETAFLAASAVTS